MGDDCRASTSDHESRTHCYGQLREQRFALIYPVFLPQISGTWVRNWRWHYHCWLRVGDGLLHGDQIVGEEEKQGPGQARASYWDREPVEICNMSLVLQT